MPNPCDDPNNNSAFWDSACGRSHNTSHSLFGGVKRGLGSVTHADTWKHAAQGSAAITHTNTWEDGFSALGSKDFWGNGLSRGGDLLNSGLHDIEDWLKLLPELVVIMGIVVVGGVIINQI